MSSLWTFDKYGRRNILIWGSIGMSIAHAIIAVLVGKFADGWPSNQDAGWTSVAFLLFYMISFGASWGPVPWAMPAEVFPSSLRAKGVAISTCSSTCRSLVFFYFFIFFASPLANSSSLPDGSTTSSL